MQRVKTTDKESIQIDQFDLNFTKVLLLKANVQSCGEQNSERMDERCKAKRL